MSLEPLLVASPIIQIHALAGMAAFAIGGVTLFLPKGNDRHRGLGRAWVALMVVVAASSFLIWEIRMLGPFSPIHLVSVFTLYALYKGVGHARAGRIGAHRRTMQSLYVVALAVTGIFTLAPGRIMYQVVFGPGAGPSLGSLVVAGGLVLAAGGWLILKPRRRGVGAVTRGLTKP